MTNGYGQSIASVDQLGNVSTRTYDSGGRTLKSINALNHETATTYDDLGRQLTVTDPLGNSRSTAYDGTTGRVSSQTDAKGNSSSNTYDARGRVTASIDRLGKTTSKTYDLEGRQLSITDAQNKQTTYVYNLLGQRTATTLPDGSARGMTYDAAGRLTQTDLASGKSKTNIYTDGANDITGLLRKVEYRNAANAVVGNDTFTYDTLLRRSGSTSRDNVDQGMNYNDRGQLTSESTTYGGQTYTVSYGYDTRGRRNEVTNPSGRKTEYSHTDRGLLDTIKWDGSEIEDRDYNALGQLTSIDRPSIDESRTYDVRGQVQTIANGAVGTATYAYDANGNKLSESWSGAMASWNFTTQSGGSDGYDAEDRFMNFNQSGQSKTLVMTRSNIGNITNVSLNGTGTARGYSNAHELTSVGSNSQSFDADGNLTSSTGGNTYDWDEAGMMDQATVAGGPTVDYGYSADGKRIWKKVGTTETVYIYSGPNCIAEYAKGAAPASSGNEYVYAGGIDSVVMLVRSAGSEKLAVTRNQQWSVSALINASGSVLERYTYAEFGKRTILAANGATVRNSSSYNMPYGYTSRRHEEETGLMYFRARYYDASTGEFISRDPLEYVDGMSLYRGYLVPGGIDPRGKMTRVDETFPANGWDPPAGWEPPVGYTVVRYCGKPITSTKGLGGHLYIVIQVNGKSYRVVRGSKSSKHYPGCKLKGDQLIVSETTYTNDPEVYPPGEDQHPDYPGDTAPQTGPDKHHCTYLAVPRGRVEVLRCVLEVAKKINECCIPYKGIPVTGVPGDKGCNSNCVATWITSQCFQGSLAPNGGIGGNWLPSGFKPLSPGAGKFLPPCVKGDVKPRQQVIDRVRAMCEGEDERTAEK